MGLSHSSCYAKEGVMKVVFTGPAFDNSGHSVVRSDLIAACESTGKFTVQSAVKADTDLLVASRTDTGRSGARPARPDVS
jgi:hypothetical protein